MNTLKESLKPQTATSCSPLTSVETQTLRHYVEEIQIQLYNWLHNQDAAKIMHVRSVVAAMGDSIFDLNTHQFNPRTRE